MFKNRFLKKVVYFLSAAIISLALAFSLQIVLAAWNAPTATPPNNNVPYPLNTSTNAQTKAGALSVAGVFEADSNTYLAAASTSNVGIGTTNPPEKLTLEGGNFLETAGLIKYKGNIADLGSRELKGAMAVDIAGKYAYVASGDDDGMEIIDIAVPALPSHVGSIDDSACDALNGGKCLLDGANSISVSGKYAYVVSSQWENPLNGADDGLEVIDISNPAAPKHIGSLSDQDCDNLNGGACALLYAKGIYISGKYAYIGGSGGQGNPSGIEIIDISNPVSPTHAGSLFSNSSTCPGSPPDCRLDGAASIYVSGKYAYVAAFWDDKMTILDVSNPAIPLYAGSIGRNSPSCPATGVCLLDEASSVYVSGKYAYVAADADNGVEIIDISNPASPSHAGQIKDSVCDAANNNACLLSGAQSVFVSGKYAYVAAGGNPSGVEILNISDPALPIHITSYQTSWPLSIWNPRSIKISGKYAYLASFNSDSFYILDISGIDAPRASIGNISASQIGVTENMDIGNNLYVRNGLNVGPGGIKSDGVIQGSSLESLSRIKMMITDTPGNCDSGTAGSLYYDLSLNEPCYCDSAGWKQVDDDGACP